MTYNPGIFLFCARFFMLILKPITFRQANDFIRKFHRHNTVVQGCKFCISVVDEAGGIHGVAIAGRRI